MRTADYWKSSIAFFLNELFSFTHGKFKELLIS